MLNLGFCLFNLIPIPPLDGSRVLYAFAPDFVRDIMDKIERYGTTLVFVLIVLFGTALGTYMGTVEEFILNIFYKIVGM
jgi:Zn-dependent protease